ncbi:MAG: hypothetical protein KBD86_02425 [Candidatus Promineofilum sp.]|nr:hypothetical protein [Promineifilum sp.]
MNNSRLPVPWVMSISAVVVILALATLDLLGICTWQYLCGPLVAEDIAQGRLDTALPAPQSDLAIEQTFVPRHDGLNEIELILVRYGGTSDALESDDTFSVELRDDTGALVAAETQPTAGLDHNQTYTLTFPPQPRSAGRLYTLRLSGSEANHISAWGYSLDVYSAGALSILTGPLRPEATASDARDLRFVTRNALTAGETLDATVAPLRQIGLGLAALLMLPLPGILLLLWLRPRGWNAAAWLGAALSLGVAAWPLLWYWVSLAGGRWSGGLLWAAVGLGWLAAALVAGRRWASRERNAPTVGHRRPVTLVYLLLAVLLLLAIAARFVAIRGLAFPPWVDSSRHALITAVMVENGRTPTGYAPLLPVDRFPYHFGFHTLPTGLFMMTGEPLPGLLLYLMQLLGGLLPLTVYAAGWMVTRRRVVGLLAAFLVALPFFFPGYYATWGRMTQLTAMMVMPVLLGLTWRVGRGWPRVWPLIGVLAAGLFFIHFRVFLFYLPFAAVAAVAHWINFRRVSGLLKAAGLGLLLILPRAIELSAATNPIQTFRQSQTGYNDFPTGYITTGWERVYLVVAAVAIGYLLIEFARRRRWTTFPLLLVVWVGALFVLLAGERLGLPETLVVNLNSMYITLFLPLALFLAIAADRLWWLADSRTRSILPARFALAVLAGIMLGLPALFGWRQQVNILNRQTILALADDLPALTWMKEELPRDARVAVNAWRWSGVTWAGSDGGAWIVPLTGLETTTPPVDHIYNRELFAAVRAFNEAASAVEDWSDPAAAAWLSEQGVSHIFTGARGGYFDPAELGRNPALEMIYNHEGTFVFALR